LLGLHCHATILLRRLQPSGVGDGDLCRRNLLCSLVQQEVVEKGHKGTSSRYDNVTQTIILITFALQLELVLMVLPQMMFVLLMLSLLVIAYAAFGPTFGRPDTSEDDYYFNSFSQSIWSIFVAITSSSWPGQILPSYNNFREVCLFFVSFICLGSYAVLNIIIIGEFYNLISDFVSANRISDVYV